MVNSKVTELIKSYREGNRDAGAYLLSASAPLINRYTKLLTEGIINNEDSTMIQYLKLINPDITESVSLVTSAFQYMTIDEIQAEIHYCLLQSAMESYDISDTFKTAFMKKVVLFVNSSEVDLDTQVEPELNDLWLCGISATSGFEELTEGERYVLLLAYHEGLSDQELTSVLSNKTNLSEDEINAIKDTAKEHLREILIRRGYFS